MISRMSTGSRWCAGMRASRSSAGSAGGAPLGLALQRPTGLLHHLPRDAQRLPVVFGQVLTQPRDAGVHLGTTQFLFGGHLAGGGHQQRRAGEKGARAAAHHDHHVGQARHVGATRRARAVLHRDHRQAGGRQAREVAKQRAAEHEAFHLVLGEVGAGAFHQVHKRQPVFQRHLLHPQDLLEPTRLDGTGLDARIAGHHHATHARPQSRCRRPRRRRAPTSRGPCCPAKNRPANTAAGTAHRGRAAGAMRSRGSSWPRLSNTGFDFAEANAARSSSARSWAMRASMASRRWVACGLWALKLDSNAITRTPWA